MKTLLGVSLLIKVLIVPTFAGDIAANEVLNCEVVPLSEYGFEQQSEYHEYVCKNPRNDADFTIIYDVSDEYKLGDNLTVGLNKHNEVISMDKQ
ncbi:hypothetical protein JOC34_000476 [Virgibacillus halotolerans]|uniref:hypothetical protein n=1 Tax=Virgibacillus halotolerans TaxID=1071053 RepID=UPI00195F7383|nr:hypothetical protein [Virgibacillus halotolerans]MBM7598119.1 hypothetical protein [Virgibacillus halotolerans]